MVDQTPCHIPKLIIVGESDPGTPPSASAAMTSSISGSRMVVVKNASHILSVECPEVVNTELRAFLTSVTNSGN